MAMRIAVDKRTGVGFGVTVAFMMLSLMVCAFFLVRGVVPERAVNLWLWISYGLAAMLGGRIASAGKGRQVCALFPAILLYVLVWLLALSCKGNIQFFTQGTGSTIAIAIGSLFSLLTAGKPKKKKDLRRKKRPTGRTVRR